MLLQVVDIAPYIGSIITGGVTIMLAMLAWFFIRLINQMDAICTKVDTVHESMTGVKAKHQALEILHNDLEERVDKLDNGYQFLMYGKKPNDAN